jgi:hypothetical protein
MGTSPLAYCGAILNDDFTTTLSGEIAEVDLRGHSGEDTAIIVPQSLHSLLAPQQKRNYLLPTLLNSSKGFL